MYEQIAQIADYVGMLGVFLLLFAYFAVSIEKLSPKKISYQVLNFLAGWLILFSLYFHWNTPSVLIEIAWIVISLIGIFRIISMRSNSS